MALDRDGTRAGQQDELIGRLRRGAGVMSAVGLVEPTTKRCGLGLILEWPGLEPAVGIYCPPLGRDDREEGANWERIFGVLRFHVLIPVAGTGLLRGNQPGKASKVLPGHAEGA